MTETEGGGLRAAQLGNCILQSQVRAEPLPFPNVPLGDSPAEGALGTGFSIVFMRNQGSG